jgi:urease accessory protein UreH
MHPSEPVPIAGWRARLALDFSRRGARTVLAARYLGASSAAAREYLARLWAIVRPALAGREAAPPPVWQG